MSHKKKKHQKELHNQTHSSLKQISGGDGQSKVANSSVEERFKKRHDEGKRHHHY